MDTETSEVIDRINARIDTLEISLRDEIRRESSSVRDDLRAEIRGEVRAASLSLREELRAESSSLREGLADNRRHTDILFESLRDDIHMLADGFAVVGTKLDSLQR